MKEISAAISIFLLVLTLLIIVAGYLVTQEARNSDRKIGMSLNGVTRITTATQFVLHAATVMILAILLIFLN